MANIQDVYIIKNGGMLVTPTNDPSCLHVRIIPSEFWHTPVTLVKRGGTPIYVENPADLHLTEDRPSGKWWWPILRIYPLSRIVPPHGLIVFLDFIVSILIIVGIINLASAYTNHNLQQAGWGGVIVVGTLLMVFLSFWGIELASIRAFGFLKITPFAYPRVFIGTILSVVYTILAIYGLYLGIAALTHTVLIDDYFQKLEYLLGLFMILVIGNSLLNRFWKFIGNL